MSTSAEGDRGDLADRINYLFEHVHPSGRGPYSNAEVADRIHQAAGDGGPTVSASLLAQLRSGIKANPTRNTLSTLAKFFGVPVAYFFDDEPEEKTRETIELLQVLRDSGIKNVALRAHGLSAGSLELVRVVIEQARRNEGLADSDKTSD